MNHSMKHVHHGFGSVRPYLCGPLGAQSISELEDKPYNERQAGFVDVGGNTWRVSTYLG